MHEKALRLRRFVTASLPPIALAAGACTGIVGINELPHLSDGGVGRLPDNGDTSSGSSGAPSSSGGGSSSDGAACVMRGDAGRFGPNTCSDCTGSAATQTLIDDMTAPVISFKPPACADRGAWYNYADSSATQSGNITPPRGSFTPYPLPSDAVSSGLALDAGVSATTKAACMWGTTGASAYSVVGMGISFGGSFNEAGAQQALFVDASSHTGIQFWAWGGGDAGTQTIAFFISDEWADPCFGFCDPSLTGPVPCKAGFGAILTIAPGWQWIQLPFASLSPSQFGAPGTCLDTSRLSGPVFQVGGHAVSFDFCVYDVSFY
jgi:hypothetical protein